ncbi:phosphodiester glycosidase family protein [bacterium]|nr:phosphodiester glycosidase family protein [bacterium]
MSTEILNLNPKRMLTTVINLSIVAALSAAIGSLIKSPPIIAQEIRIAQGGAVSPIIAGSRVKQDIKNISTDFDKSVRERYRNSLIYDIAPGIKHIRLTRTYQGRPVRINVVEVNQKLNSNIAITPQLSSSRLASKSTITSIAKKSNSIVAINGTYFKPQTGVPLGTLMIDKKLYTGPIYNRVAMGIFDNGFDMARIELNANLKTSKGDIKVDNVNQPRMLSTYVIAYTPEWGEFAPPSPKYGIQIAVEDNKITSISTQSLPIPQNGYVVVGPKDRLEPIFKARKVNLDIKTIPNWDNVNHIISGGPYLVKNGEIFIDMTEQKLGAIGGKNPRTAIGYTADGNLIMVAVDGREGASVGMTLRELAGFLQSVGCVNAMNLDGGGSTVMYVNGKVVNMPAVRGGIALSNALTIELKS